MAIIIIIFITDYILRLINRSVYKTSISQLLLLYNKQPKDSSFTVRKDKQKQHISDISALKITEMLKRLSK